MGRSTVTVLIEGDERALGPAADDEQKFLMFLTMVRGYRDLATNRLAETREHSADYRTWTYRLRRDVRWHDGVPTTAHDVAFSLDLYRHPDVLHALAQGVGNIERVTVLDDYALTVTYRHPSPGGLDGWTQFYPKHLLEDLDPSRFYEWEFWTQPVGNGPYRYVRHVPRTLIELEANPDFYDGKPAIDHVTLKLGGGNPVTELASGNIDVAIYVDHTDALAVARDPRFQVYYGWAFTEPLAIHWNHRRPLFADATVRRALTHALDRRGLRDLLDLPDEIPVMGGLAPWYRAAELYQSGELDEGIVYDPETARGLLERAGWIDRNEDGVRERAGSDARFTMLANAAGVLGTLSAAVFMQDQLRAVGVKMDIQPVARSVVNAAHRSGDFDAVISWVPNEPAGLLRSRLLEGDRIGYRSPELMRLLDVLQGELDTDRQDSLYSLVNEILGRDVPFTFLWPLTWRHVAHARIRGLGNRVNPLEYMEELWLEESAQ
jgi:peptide/nickel transport system substrate-binding protein